MALRQQSSPDVLPGTELLGDAPEEVHVLFGGFGVLGFGCLCKRSEETVLSWRMAGSWRIGFVKLRLTDKRAMMTLRKGEIATTVFIPYHGIVVAAAGAEEEQQQQQHKQQSHLQS